MTKTKIEWADRVWNPVTGCSKVSEGCRNCYAERLAKRFWGERKFTDVQCHEDRLGEPLKWKKPARIFVNSMSDLFHEDVPDEFIIQIFMTMSNELCKQHQFVVLTKRPERMMRFLNGVWIHNVWAYFHNACAVSGDNWPLSNVWLGVSVEDQKTADERIPLLLHTPAARRVVSYEPALGPVNLKGWVYKNGMWIDGQNRVDWVIMGGESGPNARPMHPDWARSVREQCQAADVPFFFKQWGEWLPTRPFDRKPDQDVKSYDHWGGGVCSWRVGKKAAGRLLDGREWDQIPNVESPNEPV